MQDYDNYNVVIAEDCSPERQAIAEVIAEYHRFYGDKISYHANSKTLGYDGNLRRLVQLATGDYVLFMGNDDLLAPGALRAVSEAIGERSDVGVVLRSYASFSSDPELPVQIFRYFKEDRVFPPGAESIVTLFRRCVFISGMVFKRSSAMAYESAEFDGTLLYQQHLAGNILRKDSGVYLNRILALHRLGGIPDFGMSESEKDLFIPKQQTPASSLQFVRGMLKIAFSLDKEDCDKVGHRILLDIGNYSYPILSIQAELAMGAFLSYLFELMKLGLWKVPFFYLYAIGLLLLGRSKCDFVITRVKNMKGHTPLLGRVYTGVSRSARAQ